MTEEQQKQEVDHARAKGIAQGMADSLVRLKAAEHRRRNLEQRLKQAQNERDEALKLMYEAQHQALAARNDLEEERRKAQLEQELTAFKTAAGSLAWANGSVNDDAYDDLVASADAKLDDLRTQRARLSAELEAHSRQDSPTMTANSVQQSPSGPPLAASRAIAVQADTGEPALINPDAETLTENSGRRLTAKSALLRVPGLLGFALDGIGINIMVNSPKGPAIFWEVVYASVAFLVALLCAAMFKVRILAGLPVLVAAIVLPSRTLPVLGPLGHWLVYRLGPM